MRTRAVLLALLACSTTGFAATAADGFRAKRWPSALRLTVDAQPELCKRVLADYTELFASPATDLDLSSAISRDLPPLEMQPLETPQNTTASLGRLELDLDAEDQTQVVIYRSAEHSWRGSWHYAYVFPSTASFEAVRSEVLAQWVGLPDSQYPPPDKVDLGGQQYFPYALTVGSEQVETGDVWADHSLFEFAKHYYFVTGTTNFDRLRQPGTARVFRLRANGHVEIACEIQPQGVAEAYQAFQRLPAVASLLEVIRAIGAGGADTGTLHSGQVHDAQATATETRAAVRPWATSAETDSSPYYRFDDRMKEYLEDWSLKEPWNRREYQTLLELIVPAEVSYAHYLESAFAVPPEAARVDAVNVIEALMGDRILVPAQFSSGQMELYFPATPLHHAIMARDRAAFDDALVHPEATPRRVPGLRARAAKDILSESLSDAIEWPYALDGLLAAGADPNDTNQFGKTPLMVAAHFNRFDSVRRLLRAGAHVDAVTGGVTDAWMEGPKRTGRTALMYAAENAGPAVIRALLDAGANVDARDSQGNGMDFYLARNPRFFDAERAWGLRELAKIPERFAGPSFDCTKARTAAERSICASEVLGILDEEMSRAFDRVHADLGPSAIQEQRNWLHTRDQSCSRGTDADCLAELLRTHVRYLHKRLGETAEPHDLSSKRG